jgi:hypothetical protein
VGDSPIREGFVSGFLLIFLSEIGDKTFFIALLLALRNPQLAVFAGTFGALAIMTVISVLLGQALHLVDEVAPLGDSPLAQVRHILADLSGRQTEEGPWDKAVNESVIKSAVVSPQCVGCSCLTIAHDVITSASGALTRIGSLCLCERLQPCNPDVCMPST